MPEGIFAEVVLPIATRQEADHPYSYRIPPSLAGRVKPGAWVEVPFGARTVTGWVIALADQSPVPETKEIRRVLADFPAFTQDLFALSQWIATFYLCPLGLVLKSLGPVWLGRSGRAGEREMVRLAVPPSVAGEVLKGKKKAPRQAGVLAALLSQSDGQGLETGKLKVSRSVLRNLEAKGLVELYQKTATGLAEPRQEWVSSRSPFELSNGQIQALATVKQAIVKGRFEAFLLHGVTGSGKTEVYLEAIASTMAQGKQAIFLVPEIALTPQMLRYLKSRFGSQVAMIHSRLSAGERARAWQRLARGEAQVAVGARSAIFAPVPNLGLIIMDEEHESSYKQEVAPRYHARDLVLKRAQLTSAVALLGSATPSMESYHRARMGYYQLLSMKERVDSRALPGVTVVDMHREMREGNQGIFSRYLQERVDSVLSRGEQVLLFMNRRGYHAFMICHECGQALKCPSCDITLTLHQESPTLRCHYCGFSLPVEPPCSSCGGNAWLGIGTGTQRIEREISGRWPQARVLRMDADAVSRRGSHEKIYQTFLRGQADILVGTQMAAKGFNFPHLTLVGVISADVSLNLPDFRARERTFQLLTQVSGRAGRGKKPGEVVVQTFFPDDYSIRAASGHDFAAFFRREAQERQRLGYPPFGFLILIGVSSPVEEQARTTAQELCSRMEKERPPGIAVLGPAPAPLARLEGRYRYQLILKGKPLSTLRGIVSKSLSGFHSPSTVRVGVNINPLLMM